VGEVAAPAKPRPQSSKAAINAQANNKQPRPLRPRPPICRSPNVPISEMAQDTESSSKAPSDQRELV